MQVMNAMDPAEVEQELDVLNEALGKYGYLAELTGGVKFSADEGTNGVTFDMRTVVIFAATQKINGEFARAVNIVGERGVRYRVLKLNGEEVGELRTENI